MRTAPGALGKPGGSGAHVSAQGKGVGSSSAAAVGSAAAGSTSMTATTGSVRVLKQCVIFVDVRTDDGDDAGGLFVDMLRGMGAKVVLAVCGRVYSTDCSVWCTRSRVGLDRSARTSYLRMG